MEIFGVISWNFLTYQFRFLGVISRIFSGLLVAAIQGISWNILRLSFENFGSYQLTYFGVISWNYDGY